MGVGNLHNGYIYPAANNASRAKAVQSSYSASNKMSPKKTGIAEGLKNTAKSPKNLTPKTKNPIKVGSFLPKQVQSVSKNVGNAHSSGFGR